MVVANEAWRAGAAYLYVLLLKGPSLAWEYLRRNPDYRRAWHAEGRDGAGAQRWRLAALENPYLDARLARPLWQPQPEGGLRLTATERQLANAARFSLWTLPGRKTLFHERRGLRLTLHLGGRIVHVDLRADLGEDMAFAYVIAAGPHAALQWQAARSLRSLLEGASQDTVCVTAVRPTRVAVAHMRSLQALDGTLAGASHREVAEAIFGVRRVAEAWHPDSVLRAQTRHWIHRARGFMERDYRSLIGIASEGDEQTCAESPFRA
jgi:hypothetical protein